MSNTSTFLQKHKLFSDLKKSQLEIICELVKDLTFTPGEEIISEGEEARELFIVKKGEVEVLKNQEDGNQYRLVVLKSGAVIGEMSLLEDIPRAATIRAITDTEIISLSITALRQFKQAKTCEERAIYYIPAEHIAHELCLRLRVANQTMVEFMHTDQLQTDATVAESSFFANLFKI